MLVVAIIGILGAIAYPSYIDSLRQSRRAEAVSALLELAVAQERWRSTHATYTQDLENFGYKNLNGQGDDGNPNSEQLASGFYLITGVSADAGGVGFQIQATVVAGTDQTNDGCDNFTIDQNGPNYSAADGYASKACWE